MRLKLERHLEDTPIELLVLAIYLGLAYRMGVVVPRHSGRSVVCSSTVADRSTGAILAWQAITSPAGLQLSLGVRK